MHFDRRNYNCTNNGGNGYWDCESNNSYGSQSNGGNCVFQSPVDVEDLAQVFSFGEKVPSPITNNAKIQHTRHHRVFRPSLNHQTQRSHNPSLPSSNYQQINRPCYTLCEPKNYPQHLNNCVDNNHLIGVNQTFDNYLSTATATGGMNSDYPLGVSCQEAPDIYCQDYNGSCKSDNNNFVQLPCNEDQWLSCTNSCPIFDNVGYHNNSINNNNQSWSNSYMKRPPSYLESQINITQNNYPSYCPFFQDEQDWQDYLSSEKRKEKSRDAARCRRSRETDIFADLAAALPISNEQSSHLDKASIMRLAIAYLKVRSVVDALEKPMMKSEIDEMDVLLPKALDGFIIVLSNNGDMVYLSENIGNYLGISQMDMMGQSVYEYSHPCDHDEIKECLLMKSSDVEDKRTCNFFIRLKCTLTSKGRKVNLKSASYKVIHCIGRPMLTATNIKHTESISEEFKRDSSTSGIDSEESGDDCEKETSNESVNPSLVVVGYPIPHPSNIEIPLGRHTFLSKHSLNMKFTYADERLSEYLGWTSDELIGKSVFEFYHALDNALLDKSYKSLFSKGQCETMAYRFLGRTGGFAWVVTQATLIHCSKQRKPLSVVCVNHILSGVECKDEVYSVRQLEARCANEKLKEKTVESNNQIVEEEKVELVEKIEEEEEEEEEEEIEEEQEQEEELADKVIVEEIKSIAVEQRPRPLAVTASIFKERVSEPKKDWLFQDKPVVDHIPSRRWPQAVTRNIFGNSTSSLSNSQESQLSPLSYRPPPQTATASIFAPRTEDMNKGFLTFSEDQPGLTMLKDEPEDLTHLAPTPGDVCVPLEDTPFLSDMLDEFILNNENYCGLLSPNLTTDLQNTDLPDDNPLKENHDNPLESDSLESDPFFYRDTSSSPICNHQSNLLSPVMPINSDSQSSTSKSSSSCCDGGGSSIGGGCDDGFTSRISDDDMLMMNIDDVIADDELALRAPYIPMSDQDEALQLLISDDMVMWGPTQPPDKISKWNTGRISKSYEESNLAKLLTSDDDLDKINNYVGDLVDPVQVLGQTCRKGVAERSNKRLHGSTTLNAGDNKRIRCQSNDNTLSKILKSNDGNSKSLKEHLECGVNIADDKILSLPQLIEIKNVSSQVKSNMRDKEHNYPVKSDNNLDKDQQQRKSQSNSVLMNLLVSGCDKTCVELPMLVKESLQQPLHINVNINNEESVPMPYLTSYETNLSSPSPKKILMDSITSPSTNERIKGCSFASPSPFFNDFSYEMDNYSSTTPLSPGSELLKVLSEAV